MSTLQELRDKRAALKEEKDGILAACESEERERTIEETERIDSILEEFAQLSEQIERLEAEGVRLAKCAELDDVIERIVPAKTRPSIPKPSNRKPEAFPALPETQVAGFDSPRQAYTAGMWLKATFNADQRAREWYKTNMGEDPKIAAAMGETSPSAGGVLVPTPLSSAIINLRDKYGTMRQLARVYQLAGDSLTIPRRSAGFTAYAVGEGDEITTSDLTTDQVTLYARKWAAMTYVATELLDDAVIDVAALIADELAHCFAAKEDACAIDGDGTSTYHGIYGLRPKIIADSRTGAVDCATAGHDTFPEVDNKDLCTVMAKCPQYALDGAAWLCSPACYGATFSYLAATAGGTTGAMLGDRFRPQYQGFPIVISAAMPNGPSTNYNNTAMLFFGNFQQGLAMGDKREFRLIADRSLRLAYDQVTFQATTRYDFNAHGLGDSSNAGPIVALIGYTS